MSDIVFILGAGASHQGGAPLMRDFLDRAEYLLRSGDAGTERQRQQFELVFRGIAALQQVYAKAMLDSDNLEDVFAAFEMAKLFGRLASLEADEVDTLSVALRTLIVRTLEQEMAYRYLTGPDTRIAPPEPYESFGGFVAACHRAPRGSVSVMTFNYDLALDLSLQGTVIDYCLTERPNQQTPELEIMKLHGSLNWRRCSICEQIVAWNVTEAIHILRPKPFQSSEVHLEIGQWLTSFTHCPTEQPPIESNPEIVPPTWNKADHYNEIANVWRRAAWHLAQAKQIFVIGYSMPATDQFFRYLYALGTVSSARLQRFWVIDPDPQVAARFQGLLGPLAEKRFRHVQDTFSGAWNQIEGILT